MKTRIRWFRPNYGYLGYYGKRSAGFDAGAAVTGSTSAPINAYPSGMSFASSTHAPNMQNSQQIASEPSSTAMPSTEAPTKHWLNDLKINQMLSVNLLLHLHPGPNSYDVFQKIYHSFCWTKTEINFLTIRLLVSSKFKLAVFVL